MGVNKVGTGEKHSAGIVIPLRRLRAGRARTRGRSQDSRGLFDGPAGQYSVFVQSGSSDRGLELEVTDSDADMIARVEDRRALTTD